MRSKTKDAKPSVHLPDNSGSDFQERKSERMSKIRQTFHSSGGVSRINPAQLDSADDLGRKMVQVTVAVEVRAELNKFKATSNAVHVWRAYALARSAGLPIHEDVIAYLDQCASAATRVTDPKEVLRMMQLSNPRGGRRVNLRAKITDDQYKQLMSLAMAYLHCGARKKKAARVSVAEQYGTTEGALRQLWVRATKAALNM